MHPISNNSAQYLGRACNNLCIYIYNIKYNINICMHIFVLFIL